MRSPSIRLNSGLFLLLAAGLAVETMAAGSRPAPSAANDSLFARLDADKNGTIDANEIQPPAKPLFDRLLRNADTNGDKLLSREEFVAGLVFTRPEKTIEQKQPDGYPQADAIRYLLLTMDSNRDTWIQGSEVPKGMEPLFEAMAERLDTNKNGTIDRYELSRSARDLIQISARYVGRERIDVKKELAKLEKSQGELAKRFDEPPGPFLANLSDPKKAHNIFAQFDANKNGQLVLEEMPEALKPQLGRFVKMADRDRSGGLSEQEFTVAAARLSRVLAGNQMKPAMDPDFRAERRARSQASKAPAKEKPIDLRSIEAKSGGEIPAESMPADENN